LTTCRDRKQIVTMPFEKVAAAATALQRAIGGDSENKVVKMGPAPSSLLDMDIVPYKEILGSVPPSRLCDWTISSSQHARSHDDAVFNAMLCDIGVAYTLMHAWEDDRLDLAYDAMCRKVAAYDGGFKAVGVVQFDGRPSFWDALRATWALFDMDQTTIIGLSSKSSNTSKPRQVRRQ
jgi:hypothetical protein